MFIIQETKCLGWADSMKDAIWPVNGHGWIESPSIGQSGGLLFFWDSTIISKREPLASKHWIWFKRVLINENCIFNIINIYSPPDLNEKISLLLEISNLINRCHGEPFCILGDFNCIRNEFEKVNYRYRAKDSEAFEKFIKYYNLWEVPL